MGLHSEFRVSLGDFVKRPCFSGQKQRSTNPHELNTNQNTFRLELGVIFLDTAMLNRFSESDQVQLNAILATA